MREKKIIRLHNVCKTHEQQSSCPTIVFHEINATFQEGEWVSIMGPSGAGKSTLLNLIGGLDRPDSGSLHVFEHKLDNMSENELCLFRNQNVGFIFQFHFLLDELNALDNVMLPHFYRKGNLKQARSIAFDILRLLHIDNRAQHYPNQISGGERQRVAIARALINQPKLLIADEPTGNLDQENTNNIRNIFLDIRKHFRFTLILATHNPHMACATDKIYGIDKTSLFHRTQK